MKHFSGFCRFLLQTFASLAVKACYCVLGMLRRKNLFAHYSNLSIEARSYFDSRK